MREIAKNAEPPSLIAHRKTAHCDYDNYDDKPALREALVAEQRGICCYCMGRIRDDHARMKVEHWRCQANYPEEQLAYRNLLGACRGGEGQPPKRQHCDTRKADRDLQWNPADPGHHIETRLRYELDGTIRADDPAFDAELEEVLNLNLPRIRNNRRSVLDGLLTWWGAQRKPVSRERLENEIAARSDGAGSLAPYSQVAIWWLSQKLARLAA